MSTARFRLFPPEQAADALEREVLDCWREEHLFERTLEARRDAPRFVFFEGPPTANGQPGIHHVFSRTIKDLFCRHRHMRGFLVPRKAGWDTHGLPVEIEVEKQLGISGKQQIEALGVEEFNRRCRESVWKYRGEWEQLSERIAYWLDYRDPYVTYTNDYIESVWWALRTLYDRGPALPGTQDPSVLSALRHGALQPRGRPGLRGRRGPEPVRGARAGRCGRRAPAAARLDDDAVDAGLERGAGRASRPRVRRAAQAHGKRLDGHPGGGARRGRARRRLHRSLGGGDPHDGTRPRGCTLRASARLGRRPGGCGGVWRDRERRLRLRGRRERHRPHGPGVRRGRLRHGPASRTGLPATGERARRVRSVDPAGRGHVGEGCRCGHHRGAPAARRAVEGRHPHPPVSALLALPDAAAVLRTRVVVHPYHGLPRPDARAQRACRVAPDRGRGGDGSASG